MAGDERDFFVEFDVNQLKELVGPSCYVKGEWSMRAGGLGTAFTLQIHFSHLHPVASYPYADRASKAAITALEEAATQGKIVVVRGYDPGEAQKCVALSCISVERDFMRREVDVTLYCDDFEFSLLRAEVLLKEYAATRREQAPSERKRKMKLN